MNNLHPQEYIQRLRDKRELIAQIELAAKKEREIAEAFPVPDKLRRATEADITASQILWYPDNDGQKWCAVDIVLSPGDHFKAFEFDGGRYGLDGAFVEIERHTYEPAPPRFENWHKACLTTDFLGGCVLLPDGQ